MDNEDNTFIINTSGPSSPSVGDIWLDMSSHSFRTIDNNMQWVSLSTDDINIDTLEFPIAVEWEHEFPAFHKVEEMCKEYPALERAYENFKTIYTMVEQDWKGKQSEQGQFPF
jgi:hypothetical protein